MRGSQLKFLWNVALEQHQGDKSRSRESPASPDSCDVTLLHWPGLDLSLYLSAFV